MNPILGSASAATTGVALKATRPPAADSKWRRVIMGSPIRQLVNSPARCGWLSKFNEQLNLETLAEVAGVGVWTFTRHFRESFGRTPHAYVIERRIDRPDVCWHRAVCRSREVASVCGFADQAHMTRVFQTHLNTTPAALRL